MKRRYRILLILILLAGLGLALNKPLRLEKKFKVLVRVFRKIAWQAVIHNPQSGGKDEDGDGLAD